MYKKMIGTQFDLTPLKEPLGFIKILEWVFAIFAFGTSGGYTGDAVVNLACNDSSSNATLEFTFSYPFRLNEIPLYKGGILCNKSVNATYLIGDYSSSVEFFVSIGVLAFLYSMVALVIYVGFLHIYRESNRGPVADFIITCLFAFFWLVSSSAWAQGLQNIVYVTSTEGICYSFKFCASDAKCTVVSHASMGRLNVSVVFGFLNLILWAGNAWFAYKETSWHTSSTGTTAQPGS
ncbi:synaptophysin-like protein 1 isoform X1 [Erpetoichthys calabaricus]|nr:synaptophysin-like protein 1 isoform X1 [Erpetoichthys calabaricus]